MTNLAEECVTVLMTRMPFGDATRRSREGAAMPRQQGTGVMKQVLRRRILNSAMSEVPTYLDELLSIERHL